ncbi:MAG: hypothetical protein QG608_2972 [Actinomycetota bacterium]|nr:hypothetical protein [Actinomycetota bacterium]
MSRVEQRLSELGIELAQPVAPLAAYVPAVLDGDRVWVSGQLPLVGGELLAKGLVGNGPGSVSVERACELARQCAINGLAALRSVVGDLDRVVRVVKVVGYVVGEPGFTGQPAVIDGASKLLQEVFQDAGRHARSAVGVAGLPLGSPVEVELVFSVSPA